MVARLLWEQEARGSSPRTPTTLLRKTAFLGGFSAFFVLFRNLGDCCSATVSGGQKDGGSTSEESGRLVGEIVSVSADEFVLDEAGKIDPDKLRPITCDPIHSAYRVLGEKVGNAFRDGAQLK